MKEYKLQNLPVWQNTKTHIYLVLVVIGFIDALLLLMGIITAFFSIKAFLIFLFLIFLITGSAIIITLIIGVIIFSVFNFLYKKDGLIIEYEKHKDHYLIKGIKNYWKWVLFIPAILIGLGILTLLIGIGFILIGFGVLLLIETFLMIIAFNFVSKKYSIKIKTKSNKIINIDGGSLFMNNLFVNLAVYFIVFFIGMIIITPLLGFAKYLFSAPQLVGISLILFLVMIIEGIIISVIETVINTLIYSVLYNWLISKKEDFGFVYKGRK